MAVVLGIITLAVALGTVSAYAETSEYNNEGPGIVERILSNEHIQIATFVAIAGVTLRTWARYINKTVKDVEKGQIVFSFVIALLTSFAIVMPILEAIPDTAEAETWLITIIGTILTVYASDSIGRKGKQFVESRIHKQGPPPPPPPTVAGVHNGMQYVPQTVQTVPTSDGYIPPPPPPPPVDPEAEIDPIQVADDALEPPIEDEPPPDVTEELK